MARETQGGRVRNPLFWVGGWIIICLWWKWQSLLAAQQRRTTWWARLASSPLTLWHTHTSSYRHVHLHTPTHIQSSAVSATRCMLSSHMHTRAHTNTHTKTLKDQDFHHKIISRERSRIKTTHTLLSQNSPHPLVKNVELDACCPSPDKFMKT